MRVRIVAGGSARLEPVTQVAPRDERYATSELVHRLSDTRSKTQEIFIGEITVAERYDLSLPTVAKQEIKRNGNAVIEILSGEHRHVIPFRGRGFSYRIEQFLIDLRGEIGVGRVEA